MDVLYLSFAFL